MKLLVTAATWPEMRIVKEHISTLKIPHIEVEFLITWIGNYETIYTLTKHLQSKPEQKSDFLLNVWVCWYKANKQDVVQIASIINASTWKETIVPVPTIIYPLGNIVSSETIVSDPDTLVSDYCDMESFGVDMVCQKWQIPRILLKVPVDRIGEETKHFDREKALGMLSNQIDYRSVVEKIAAWSTLQTR